MGLENGAAVCAAEDVDDRSDPVAGGAVERPITAYPLLIATVDSIAADAHAAAPADSRSRLLSTPSSFDTELTEDGWSSLGLLCPTAAAVEEDATKLPNPTSAGS